MFLFFSAKNCICVYACDCSSEVLEIAKEMIATANLISIGQRFHPFLLDFSIHTFPEWLFCTDCRKTLPKKQVDFTSGSNYNLNGVVIHPTLFLDYTFMGLWCLYTFLSDANSKDLMGLNPRGAKCCIGGVDFVTLVSSFAGLIKWFFCWFYIKFI